MIMICKTALGRIFLTPNYFVKRLYTSALYVTGDKAQKTFAVLTPVIDFDQQLENRDNLKSNLEKRGANIDIGQIEKKWRFFQDINKRKQHLESTRSEIGRAIAQLLKNADANKEEIEKLKLHARVVKDDLKNLRDAFYEIEEDTMVTVLGLPNVLHERTPQNESVLANHSDSEIIGTKSESHIIIGEAKNYIEYLNPLTCYLKSDAALFEMSISNYFRKCLLNFGYLQFSNPNFCRSVVVEGCGDSFNEKVFTLEEEEEESDVNRLHLCGSSSLYSFMAYFARHAVQQTNFPLKYFSHGKIYTPSKEVLPKSLFTLSQQAVLNIFIATSDDAVALDSIIKDVSAIYEPLGYPFRLSLSPAKALEKAESLRLSIQMYSNYLQSYVEVGNVSLYESYISKRLLFTYSSKNSKKYAKIVGGTLLNVPKVLGCVLENNSCNDSSLMSDLLKSHLFL